MSFFNNLGQGIVSLIEAMYNLLWGDLISIPLPGGSSLGLSILVIILIPSGIYFTIRTRFLPFRLFPEMLRVTAENRSSSGHAGSISGVQALIVSTATRVGMGNLVGVVAAISAGGAGAVFWMWLIALLGSSTAFIEATLAQLYKEKDPLYGGYRGGPAYYLHQLFAGKKGPGKRSAIASLFALSGLICWCGISQVIGNSVSSAFRNAFHIPPLYTTVALVALAAIIVLRKHATVKVLDLMVPVMAALYFVITLYIIIRNAGMLPQVFARIFEEAFGLRQAVSGGIGAVIMNGAKRGLFSNEAGSGSAPCAAAAADVSHPVKAGLLQSLGVFIDTLVICSCTAFIMLLTPAGQLEGMEGMDLLQEAMNYHFGSFGAVFIAVILWLFSFSTFIGILFYARFIGGLAAYTFVWDLGDLGVGLMTIFNMIALFPMAGEALEALKDYDHKKKNV